MNSPTHVQRDARILAVARHPNALAIATVLPMDVHLKRQTTQNIGKTPSRLMQGSWEPQPVPETGAATLDEHI